MTDIKILYGSETGTSEGLANNAGTELKNAGFNTEVLDMSNVVVKDLKEYKKLLIITSTWGDGTPPSNAEELHDELETSSIDLSNLNYAIFAIGDTGFEKFCQTGIDFDNYLENLGSKRVLPLEKAEYDYETKFLTWLDKVKEKFSSF